MKRICLKLCLFVFIGSLAFWSCSDDDDLPFDGSDNTINSFELTTLSGEKYAGAISGDQISVSAPLNVSLNGAHVALSVCEQASVSPDPATIVDWDAEQSLIVTSYNKQAKGYTYRVVREDVPSEGSVVLATQSDVKALAESGVSVISGDLIIGQAKIEEVDPVVDLSALTRLVEVKRNIVINASFAGENLDGLQNIRSAAGIYIGNASVALNSQSSFDVELPGIKHVGQFVVNSDFVKTVRMAGLKETGWFFVNGNHITGMDFSSLTLCSSNFSMKQSSSVERIAFPALKSVDGIFTLTKQGATEIDFPALERIGQKVTLEDLSVVEALSFPELQSIGASMSMKRLNELVKFSMPKLQSIGGEFKLDVCPLIAAMDFSSLKTVEGLIELRFSTNVMINELNLPELQRVKESFSIYTDAKAAAASGIQSISFPKLEDCPKLYFYRLYDLTNLDVTAVTNLSSLSLIVCPAVKVVRSAKVINNVELNAGQENSENTNFPDLEEVPGKFEITNYTKNEEFVMENLKKAGTLTVNSSNGLLRVSFPDLEEVKSLNFGSIYTLTRIEAVKLASIDDFFSMTSTRDLAPEGLVLSNLKKIGGKLTIDGFWDKSSKFSNMSAFSGLTELGAFSVASITALTDFTGLKNVVANMVASAWSVSNCGYNPTLADMQDGKFTK